MIKLTLTERRVRLTTGLIMALYIIVHMSNHTLGLISLEAMESMREVVTPFWRSWVGGALIYGSLLTHFGLALVSLYRRKSLRMPFWELSQLVLGLSIIPLLAGHVAGTWGVRIFMDLDPNYRDTLTSILNDNWLIVRQTLLVVVAWVHVVIGLHYFCRLFSWYRRWSLHMYPFVILVPLLVILAAVRVGFEMDIKPQTDGYEADYESSVASEQSEWQESYGYETDYGSTSGPGETHGNLIKDRFHHGVLITFYAFLLLTLLARQVRDKASMRSAALTVKHINGRELKGRTGQSILEIVRDHSVPHASLCGGRGRCTTCRVRVGEGLAELESPSTLEQSALDRIGAAMNVRLACQTRPTYDLQITPVLPADLGVEHSLKRGGVSGEEREVVAMFVDLRGSTNMGELHLPYDVLFILNQFFVEMSASLAESNGHYAQFAGDGLMALYGLERGLRQGCLDALQGAVNMQRRISQLNQKLSYELREPLRIGIGIHCGMAIVGTMGPPTAPNFSAIGDCINATARIEGLCKELGCTLLVSNDVVQAAEINLERFQAQEVMLRGKQRSVVVYRVNSPLELADCI